MMILEFSLLYSKFICYKKMYKNSVTLLSNHSLQ